MDASTSGESVEAKEAREQWSDGVEAIDGILDQIPGHDLAPRSLSNNSFLEPKTATQ